MTDTSSPSDTSTSNATKSQHSPKPFADLGLSHSLCVALDDAGYVTPTPIQQKAIPYILKGKDLLGCAQTGTGKTAAFALPILQKIMNKGRSSGKPVIQTLVLAPTRELAAQIGASFETYAGVSGPRQFVVFGGVSKNGQIKALRQGVEVLVATPGRLLDLMNDGIIRLNHVETFVLDEADRMLDMGFIHDVRKITKAIPTERQTLLFSATMPKEIQDLADRILKTPVRVAVDPVSSTREPISQAVYFVEKSSKTKLLLKLLADDSIDRALVFTRTKHGANKVVKKLHENNFGAAAIHGNKSQSARVRALDDFKSGRIRIVVATDIAARGIDVKGLSHVINFDLPNEPESYVHRIGRTGRAGESGIAVSFCCGEERGYLRDIQQLIKRDLDDLPLPEGITPAGKEVKPPPMGGGRRPQRTNSSRRPSGGGNRKRSATGRSGEGGKTSGRSGNKNRSPKSSGGGNRSRTSGR